MKTEKKVYQSYEDVCYAAEVLKKGGLVVFPTETVYGLGALMSCPEAVKRIYAIKGRAANKPLSILLADAGQITSVTDLEPENSKEVQALADAFWPGPLTLVLPRNDAVPDLVTAGRPTVGIRIPDHAFALQLVKEAGGPVVTTSANLSGSAAAVTAGEAEKALSGAVDLLIDGGACSVQQASTVAGFQDRDIVIFREGRITRTELLAVCGRM